MIFPYIDPLIFHKARLRDGLREASQYHLVREASRSFNLHEKRSTLRPGVAVLKSMAFYLGWFIKGLQKPSEVAEKQE